MVYTVEMNLNGFEFWGGAVQVAADIDELENAAECWAYLDEMLDEFWVCRQHMSQTEVNDFVWFDAWDVLGDAGLLPDGWDE